jgi:hypothetical protein
MTAWGPYHDVNLIWGEDDAGAAWSPPVAAVWKVCCEGSVWMGDWSPAVVLDRDALGSQNATLSWPGPDWRAAGSRNFFMLRIH